MKPCSHQLTFLSQQGWSMFSIGASKLAESALKFGEIASQKVVQVSESVGEKV